MASTNGSVAYGRSVPKDPRFNRGSAFTTDERSALALQGLLPAAVLSLEEQAQRSYEPYRAQPTDPATHPRLG